MKILRALGLLLLFFTATGALGEEARRGTRDAERVAAFARLYGVVRHFHPGDALQELDWNRFAVYGVQRMHAAPDHQAAGQALRELFAPIAAGVQVLPERQPYPPLPPPVRDPSRVLWQHLGYADGVSPYSTYQAKRTHRAGIAASYPVTPTPPGSDYDAPEALLYPVPATLGRVVDFPLGDGWKARVPLDLAAADAAVTPAQRIALDALKANLAQAVPAPGTTLTAAQRQADVLVTWNVLRHFYPYWVDVDTDWDAQLLPRLREANQPADRAQQQDTLRRLIAAAQDGHGQVVDRQLLQLKLPVRIEPVEGRLLVTASLDPAVQAGDRIVAIDGMPAKRWLERRTALAPGSAQWRPWRVMLELLSGPAGNALPLRLERGGQRFDVILHYDHPLSTALSNAVLPAPIVELRPRVWYVDLGRVTRDELQPYMDRLVYADALVFDLRTYPKDDTPALVLSRLLDHAEHAKWAFINYVDGPFQQLAGNDGGGGWDLQPEAPRFHGRAVFLSNGNAISFADSVLDYVKEEQLGLIVGSTSAGTSGNIQGVRTPGDYFVRFTGMRVTRHDGHTPIHLIGTVPDVWVTPTIAGLRAGRDEVLERALQVLGAR